MNEKVFNAYPMESLLAPTDNSTVKMNMYWLVKDGNVFQHKLTKVWQCNKNKGIVDLVAETVPGSSVMLLPYAYVRE